MALSLSGTPQSAVGTGTTCTINVPATPVAGDALVAMIAADTVVTFTKPASFTLIGTQADTSAGIDQIIGAWYRICDGSEGASFAWTFASNAFAGGMLLIHSSAGTVAFDTFQPSQGAASTANIINAGLTTATANEMLVGGFALDISPSGAVTHTAPGTMAEQIDVNSGTWAAIEIATEIFGGPGATGTRTAVGSIATSNGTVSILAAFKEVISSVAPVDYVPVDASS